MKPLICRFCGKTHLNIENLVFKTNKEAEEYATLHCDCVNGESYRNKSKSLEKLDNFLNTTSYDKETKDFLKQCGLHVLDSDDVVITYQFDDTKIKFQMKKGCLKIEIVRTDKTERTF